MQPTMDARSGASASISKRRLWASWVISGSIAAFTLFDAATKLARPAPVTAAFARTGWPVELSVPVGIILLVCTVLYLIPRTSILGAILLTGYLGGAVATNLRLENPMFSNTLFPVYFGILAWVALWLRNGKLRELIPLRKNHS